MDSIIEKIKKCLALSESSNENEAFVALKQMNALLAKHNLSMSDVYHSDILEREFEYRAVKLPYDICMLMEIVSEVFNCSAFYEKTSSRTSNIIFIGDKISVEIAEYAFNVLLAQLKRSKAKYVKELKLKTDIKGKKIKLSPHQIKTLSTQYSNAWVCQVSEKCKSISPDKVKMEIVNSYVSKKVGDVEVVEVKIAKRKTDSLSVEARKKGYKDGSDVNLFIATGYTPNDQKLIETK